eukprot:480525_1
MAEQTEVKVEDNTFTDIADAKGIKKAWKPFTIWPLIGKKLGAQVLYGRLKDYYSMIASISGLISGFVFVVTTTPVTWKYEGYIPKDIRSDLFGAFLLLGLVTALLATLFATALYGLVNMIGPDDELLILFIDQNSKFVGKPNSFMIASVIIMLIGSGIAVGGLYSLWVFVLYIVATVTFCAFLVAYYSYWGKRMQLLCKNKLEKMPDFNAKKEQ